MGALIDLTGKTFGRWTVIERVFDKKSKQAKWLCECSCNNHTRKIVSGQRLRNGESKSCGCLHKEIVSKNSFKDLTGQTFGYLEVLSCTGEKSGQNYIWECKCLLCENKTKVKGGDLANGHTSSCGCLSTSIGERRIKDMLEANNIKYISQYTFSDCRYKDSHELVRFDFYLPEYNRIVEFDGIQHFRANGGWNTEEKFQDTKKRDNFRNEYALSHNIPLVRIPYWERDNITLELIMGDKYLVK